MTLVPAALKTVIIAELATAQGASQDTTIQTDANTKLAEALSNAIINYMVANTVVTVAVTGASGTGTIS